MQLGFGISPLDLSSDSEAGLQFWRSPASRVAHSAQPDLPESTEQMAGQSDVDVRYHVKSRINSPGYVSIMSG